MRGPPERSGPVPSYRKIATQPASSFLAAPSEDCGGSGADVLDAESTIAYAERFPRDLAAIWADSDVSKRRRFQALVFPEPIEVGASGAVSSNPAT